MDHKRVRPSKEVKAALVANSASALEFLEFWVSTIVFRLTRADFRLSIKKIIRKLRARAHAG